jgi:hypothetical protein
MEWRGNYLSKGTLHAPLPFLILNILHHPSTHDHFSVKYHHPQISMESYNCGPLLFLSGRFDLIYIFVIPSISAGFSSFCLSSLFFLHFIIFFPLLLLALFTQFLFLCSLSLPFLLVFLYPIYFLCYILLFLSLSCFISLSSPPLIMSES